MVEKTLANIAGDTFDIPKYSVKHIERLYKKIKIFAEIWELAIQESLSLRLNMGSSNIPKTTSYSLQFLPKTLVAFPDFHFH